GRREVRGRAGPPPRGTGPEEDTEASGRECPIRGVWRQFRRQGLACSMKALVRGRPMPRRANHSRDDLRILARLSDIGVALGTSPALRRALERMLERLEAVRGIVRGAVFLLHEDTGQIHVEAALGISSEGMRARYRPGEGIIGRVVQSGRPVVVPA